MSMIHLHCCPLSCHFMLSTCTGALCVYICNVYMYEILFVLPQVDCWYVVLNGYRRYCRENEPVKQSHVREGNHNGNVMM